MSCACSASPILYRRAGCSQCDWASVGGQMTSVQVQVQLVLRRWAVGRAKIGSDGEMLWCAVDALSRDGRWWGPDRRSGASSRGIDGNNKGMMNQPSAQTPAGAHDAHANKQRPVLFNDEEDDDEGANEAAGVLDGGRLATLAHSPGQPRRTALFWPADPASMRLSSTTLLLYCNNFSALLDCL